MKTCAWALAALVTSVAFADKVAVDWLDVDGLAVTNESETVTQEDSIVLADGATFAKVGAGKLVLPLDKIDKTFDYKLRVTEGRLKIEQGTSFVPPTGVPDCISAKAKLWLDASADNGGSVVYDSDSKIVSRWCDRRETDRGSPTRIYAQPTLTPDAVTKLPQTYVTRDGVPAVYFGGYDKTSGSYMKLMSNAADATVTCIRHAFIVHGCFECWNAPLGNNGDPRDYFTNDSLANALNCTAHYIWYGHTSPGCFTARHYLDGVRFDPYSVGPKIGFQLLEDEYVDKPSVVRYLFCNNNVLRRAGGDYLSEVILFTNQLSVAERLDVERYLMRKWNLGAATAQTGKGELAVAPGATVSFNETDRLSGFSLTGVGSVVKDVSGPLYVGAGLFNSYDGEMDLQAGELKIVKGSVPSLSLTTGDLVKTEPYSPYPYAQENYTNLEKYAEMAVAVTRTAQGAGAGQIEKRGEEEIGAFALPSDLKKLVVKEGMFTLRGAVTNSGLVAGAAIRAYIPNADFEEPCQANATYNRSTFASGTKKNHWTKDSDSSTVGYLVEDHSAGDVHTSDAHSRGTFSPFPIRQGAQVLIICNSGAAYTDEAYFPKSGYYEVTLLESSRYPLFNKDNPQTSIGSYEIRIGDDWSSAQTKAVRRMVNAGHYTRVRLKLGYVEEGTHVFGFKAAKWMTKDGAVLLDDIRVSFVGETPEAGLVEIPNGDFEDVTNRTIAVAAAVNPYLLPLRDSSNEAVGWTFANTDSALPAVAVVSATAPAPYKSDVTDMRFSDTADGLYGSVHLSFHGVGGTASTSFTVPAGTYRLRGKLARWGGHWEGVECRENNPTVHATVSVGGTETDLGNVVENAHVMRQTCWPNAFTVAEAGTVTLTLEQTTAKSAMLVDDLTLVDATRDEVPSDELIVNGSFETGTDATAFPPWTRVSGTFGSSNATRVDPWEDLKTTPSNKTPHQFGAAPYDGLFYVRIVNDAGLYQTVTLEKGLYRLSFATHDRFTPGYNNQRFAAWLGDASGQKVLDIGCTAVATYNDIEHVWFFRVAEAGTYRLYLQGTDHWKAQFAKDGQNHTSMIDGVSLKRVQGDARQPVVPEALKIDVADGASLRLDFDGTVTTGAVTYNGERLLGEISAVTHPEFVQGRGVLNATPSNKGMVLIYR